MWAKDRLPAALWMFDRAVREDPNNVMALADASRAFGSVYQYRRSEMLLQRLIRLGQGRADVLHLAAQSYRLIRRPECALECFEAALRAGKSNPDLHLELALLYERFNKLDRAVDHIQRRLRLLPRDSEGRVVQGRLLRRTEHNTASETVLREVAQQGHVFWMTRMRALSELATLYDQQGAYGQAWQAMLAAKTIGRSPCKVRSSTSQSHHADAGKVGARRDAHAL